MCHLPPSPYWPSARKNSPGPPVWGRTWWQAAAGGSRKEPCALNSPEAGTAECGHGECRPSPKPRDTNTLAPNLHSETQRQGKRCRWRPPALLPPDTSLRGAGLPRHGCYSPSAQPAAGCPADDRTRLRVELTGSCLCNCHFTKRHFTKPPGHSCVPPVLELAPGQRGLGAEQPRSTSTSSIYSATGMAGEGHQVRGRWAVGGRQWAVGWAQHTVRRQEDPEGGEAGSEAGLDHRTGAGVPAPGASVLSRHA